MTALSHLVLPAILAAVLQTGSLTTEDRPGLFFREDWKESPAATPVTQEHVANPNLVLKLYGPGKDGIKKSHHDNLKGDPFYIWSGMCTGNWAVALRHRGAFADLTGQAKIRWRSKQGGARRLRLILKLADGTWIVGDPADGESSDWREKEITIADLTWCRLDIDKVVEGAGVEKPDLRNVDEIGFSDLMAGGASAACSRLDWIEVLAPSVKR